MTPITQTYRVNVGIVFDLAFEPGELESKTTDELKLILAENFLAHPALSDPKELAQLIDSFKVIQPPSQSPRHRKVKRRDKTTP